MPKRPAEYATLGFTDPPRIREHGSPTAAPGLRCFPAEWGYRPNSPHLRHNLSSELGSNLACELQSPLTESNRRPSPYHLKFSRFTARRALPAGRRQALIWFLPRRAASATAQAIAPAAQQQPVRVQPQAAAAPAHGPGLSFRPGPWGCLPTSHVHSDGQKTVTRSSPPACPGPEGHAEQALSYQQEEIEPAPLSSSRRKSSSAAQDSWPSRRSHRRTCRTQNQATQSPERSQWHRSEPPRGFGGHLSPIPQTHLPLLHAA